MSPLQTQKWADLLCTHFESFASQQKQSSNTDPTVMPYSREGRWTDGVRRTQTYTASVFAVRERWIIVCNINARYSLLERYFYCVRFSDLHSTVPCTVSVPFSHDEFIIRHAMDLLHVQRLRTSCWYWKCRRYRCNTKPRRPAWSR